MSILVYKDKTTASVAAATLVAARLIEKPSNVFGLDYCDDLSPLYRALIRMSSDGLVDWSEARAFVLSENVHADEDESIVSQITRTFLERVSIRPENRFYPNTDTKDWSVVCNDYENSILRVGGIETAVLAVRADGSVAHNVAAAELAPVTHVERTERGRILTAGITTIMSAQRLIVLVLGADKADVAPAVFGGPIVPQVPASYLQLHQNAVFLLDEDAAVNV